MLAALAAFAAAWTDGPKGGVALMGASRVLAGEVPYRDFWTLYAPGHFYLLAALLAVFGSLVLVGTVAGSILCAVAVGLVHRLAGRLGAGPWAAAGCAGLVAASLFSTPYPRSLATYPPVLVCMLLGWLAYTRALREPSRGRFLLAGMAVGAAALFKHDVGAYTGIAMAVGVVTAGGAFVRPLAWLALGAALVAAPVYGALTLVAGADLWRDLVIFPATAFRDARPESYPSLLPAGWFESAASKRQVVFNAARWVEFALPFGVWLAALAVLVRRRSALAAAFATAFALHWWAAHAQINTHIVSMTLYAALLGLGLWTARPRPLAVGGLVAGLVTGWILCLSARPALKRVEFWHAPARTPALAPLAGTQVPPGWADLLEGLADEVHRHAPPGTPIYVGPHRHDVVIIGDPLVYFELERPSATRYHELHPAVSDTDPVQAEMVRDLERLEVPVIVLRRHFSDAHLDAVKTRFQKTLPQVGATRLDAFIRSRYVPGPQFGPYRVWLLNDRAKDEAAASPPEPGGSLIH